jgi:hypothetical protein
MLCKSCQIHLKKLLKECKKEEMFHPLVVMLPQLHKVITENKEEVNH